MKKILISLSVIAGAIAVAVGSGTIAFFSDTEESVGNVLAAGAIDLKIDNTSYYNGVYSSSTSWLEPADLSGHLFFNFTDLKPGDWGEDTISVHVDNNDSWLCADVTLTANNENGVVEPEIDDGDNATSTDGELGGRLNFVWWADDGDNVYENNEVSLPGGPIGNLAVNQTAHVSLADSQANIWNATSGMPLTGSSTRYIGKAWCFGSVTPHQVAQDGVGFTQAEGGNGPDVRGSGWDCNGSTEDNTTQTDSVMMDIGFRAEQARNNAGFLCNPNIIQ